MSAVTVARRGRVQVRAGAVEIAPSPLWPVTIWVNGGSGTHGGKALPYISKQVWGPQGWNHVGIPSAGYMSLEVSAVDSAGVVWAAGCVRSTVGNPPEYHWTNEPSGYAINLRIGWIPWAYYTMLPRWVLTPGYNSGGLVHPYTGYRLVKRGERFWTYVPPGR